MTASLFAIFGAGVLTVFSPCVLPVAPILVAGLVGGEDASRWSRLRAALWFGGGFALTFTSIGLGLTAVLGITPLRAVFLILAAILIGLYGVKMMGLVDTSRRLSWMDRSVSAPVRTPSRAANPALLGALFAVTWTPCAGPVLAGVLTYVASRPASMIPGATMLLVYAAGVATPLLLVAAASEYVTPLLQRLGARLGMIERATGAVLVALAAFLVIQIPSRAGTAPAGGAAAGVARPDGDATPGVQRLLFFHSEHCPTCRAMEAVLPALERACASARWTLTRIDVDRSENADTVARYDVHAVPTTSLVDADGHEHLRLIGFQPEARLREAIEGQLRIACSDDGSPPDVPVEGMPTCEIGNTC